MASHYREPARAVLGPTNTGKTHLAIERMLDHGSGMIWFPLRLLARENYDRVVRRKGPQQVALLTGEEKIVPPHARYFLCTVESMPLQLEVAFLAVDEIQLCADPARGHAFTDRLLHARGTRETLFLGADTIAPLLRRLLPEVAIDTRPRLSALRHSGYKNISRLPAKSAVVAFSAADVYTIAELMRRQKGGAAVVLGALSPRTRNAQVALYQAGEVDTLVATDAIGMGLNLDLHHVAFAALAKFDGRRRRALSPAEIGQIAGRAGRHQNDGTFGITADAPPLDPEVVEQLESHQFAPLTRLYWRNTRLRFTSIDDLLADLRRPPPRGGLVRPRDPEDERALEALARDPQVLALVRTSAHVRLLWEVCRIPDFRTLHTDAHPRLLGQVFRQLRTHGGQLPVDWVEGQVRRLARRDGDIDVLTQRIAGIRTWTYMAHCAEWLPDPVHWQERTRSVEDQLSDALHEQLTRRFVDRRTAVLVQGLKGRQDLTGEVTRSGDVLVAGHFVGRLEGLRFVADSAGGPRGTRAVTAAAMQALGGEMNSR
ncbi:MAG TPA: helicase-related protein, partial [Deferrisomatales bacterium]|nr:helicase-related protein [Deferrisomatales bacterium]